MNKNNNSEIKLIYGCKHFFEMKSRPAIMIEMFYNEIMCIKLNNRET